jgi:hypothetical protein
MELPFLVSGRRVVVLLALLIDMSRKNFLLVVVSVIMAWRWRLLMLVAVGEF